MTPVEAAQEVSIFWRIDEETGAPLLLLSFALEPSRGADGGPSVAMELHGWRGSWRLPSPAPLWVPKALSAGFLKILNALDEEWQRVHTTRGEIWRRAEEWARLDAEAHGPGCRCGTGAACPSAN